MCHAFFCVLKLINNSSSYTYKEIITMFFYVDSFVFVSIDNIYIKHSRQCFIRFPNTANLSKILRYASYFNSLLGVWKSDETLSAVFKPPLSKSYPQPLHVWTYSICILHLLSVVIFGEELYATSYLKLT